MIGGALFGSAGRMDWPAAWALVVFFAVFSAVGMLALDPDLIHERTSVPPDIQLFDVVIAGSAFVLLFPVTLIVCGLDFRFAWSAELPLPLRGIASAVVASGYAFSLWAARTNPFFSTVVRIQVERGHHVIDSGPYAFVRHPGYAGPLLAHIALPIALESPWGLVPAVFGVALMTVRAAYEDATLMRELPGYQSYAARVRWRLVPGLW
jgi:protein-S-isoprenylcysteine O-methyltransferase Ste14